MKHKRNKFEKILEEVFVCGFNAGRLYTFRNKVVDIDKLTIDAHTEFWRYEKIPNENNITWLDIVKSNVLVEREDLKLVIDTFLTFIDLLDLTIPQEKAFRKLKELIKEA